MSRLHTRPVKLEQINTGHLSEKEANLLLLDALWTAAKGISVPPDDAGMPQESLSAVPARTQAGAFLEALSEAGRD
jgi:hypothetical protein